MSKEKDQINFEYWRNNADFFWVLALALQKGSDKYDFETGYALFSEEYIPFQSFETEVFPGQERILSYLSSDRASDVVCRKRIKIKAAGKAATQILFEYDYFDVKQRLSDRDLDLAYKDANDIALRLSLSSYDVLTAPVNARFSHLGSYKVLIKVDPQTDKPFDGKIWQESLDSSNSDGESLNSDTGLYKLHPKNLLLNLVNSGEFSKLPLEARKVLFGWLIKKVSLMTSDILPNSDINVSLTIHNGIELVVRIYSSNISLDGDIFSNERGDLYIPFGLVMKHILTRNIDTPDQDVLQMYGKINEAIDEEKAKPGWQLRLQGLYDQLKIALENKSIPQLNGKIQSLQIGLKSGDVSFKQITDKETKSELPSEYGVETFRILCSLI